MKNHVRIAAFTFLTLLAAMAASGSQFSGRSMEATAQESGESESVPVKGMVTMIDLGAKACIPCKMMIPVMESVEKKYKGKAAVLFFDVWKDKAPAERFGIRAIPTLIIFKGGQVVEQITGAVSRSLIENALKKAL